MKYEVFNYWCIPSNSFGFCIVRRGSKERLICVFYDEPTALAVCEELNAHS